MDLLESGDLGSGCEDENCSFTSGCSSPECFPDDSLFGMIELVCVTLVYIPVMLFGLLGNTLTILVVWLRPYMRSSTYLYLSSMAVSDLLILLLLPVELYKLWRPRPWPFGDVACKLTVFLSECCTFCTILHITCLSLERYLAVCWPITAKTLVTRRRTVALIGCLWLGAVASAAPILVMVGVENVGGEEVGGWREGEHGGFAVGGGETGSGHMALIHGRPPEGVEERGWGVRVEELKSIDDRGGKTLGIVGEEERKRGEEEGGRMGVEGERRDRKREDEGGGGEAGGGGGGGGGEEGDMMDNRECRCTEYAVSSGLLSAMMILSNLYFLIPLCILSLVYSLIGRTLWLRPQSSRRDKSHRHIVKMLGVIVLAFILCWLPFHVARTIFTLTRSSDSQETYVDSALDPDPDPPSEEPVDPAFVTPTDPCSDDDPPLGATYTPPDAHDEDTFTYYLSQYFNLASSFCFYLSAAINPLLYNLMSARYRQAVHSLVHKQPLTPSHRLHTLTSRHSTTTM